MNKKQLLDVRQRFHAEVNRLSIQAIRCIENLSDDESAYHYGFWLGRYARIYTEINSKLVLLDEYLRMRNSGLRASEAFSLARGRQYAIDTGIDFEYEIEFYRYEDVYGEKGDPNAEYCVLLTKRNGEVIDVIGFTDINDREYCRIEENNIAYAIFLQENE